MNPQEAPSAAVEQLRDAEREKLTLFQLSCCFVCAVCCVCVESSRSSTLLIIGSCTCFTIYKKELVLLRVGTKRVYLLNHVTRV